MDYDGYGTYPKFSNELDVLRSSVRIIYDDQSGLDLQLGDGYKDRKTSSQILLDDEMLDDFRFDFSAHGAYPIIGNELNEMKRSANGEEEILDSEMEKKTFSSFLRSICWVFCCCFRGRSD
ncbi:uncharacterized protein [Parasteatoda tepidariorum]|uniref:uncharacterized protein n=1 Tax=Parasteatoda tepidariorum TaxID=114398 RepID=UPI0039BD7A96